MIVRPLALAGLFTLAACGGLTAGDNAAAPFRETADRAEDLADNATNEATEDTLEDSAEAMDNAADRVKDAVDDGDGNVVNAAAEPR